jgi:hypothetical protein
VTRAAAPAVLALAFALRAAAPGTLPIFVDEGIHIAQAREARSAGTWLRPGIARYLPTWINAVVVAPRADPLRALRWSSALWGTLTAAGLMMLGRVVGPPAAGVLAALLYAIVPYGVVHDRIGLVDPLMAALVVWSVVAAATWRARPTPGRSAALGLLLGALLLTKPYGALGWALPLLFLPRRADGGRAWTAAAGVLMVSALAAAPFFLDLRQVAPIVAEGQGASVAEVLAQAPSRLAEAARWHWTYLTPVGVVLAVAAIGRRARKGETPGPVLGAWILWGPALALALALSSSFSQFPRHLLPSVPLLLYVVASEGTPLFGSRGGRWAAMAALSALAVPSLVLDIRFAVDPRRAAIADADRWQYVTGWPSGYGLDEVSARLRAESAAREIVVVRTAHWVPLSVGLDVSLRDAPRIARVDVSEPEAWADEATRLLASGRAVYLAREVEAGSPDVPVLDLRGRVLSEPALQIRKPEGARVVELFAVAPADPAPTGLEPAVAPNGDEGAAGDATVLARGGVAAALRGDLPAAAVALREAAARDPGEVTLRYDLGVVLAALRRGAGAPGTAARSDVTH